MRKNKPEQLSASSRTLSRKEAKRKLSGGEIISPWTRKIANAAIYSCDLLATGVAVIYEWAVSKGGCFFFPRNNRVLSDDLVSSRKILRTDARCTFKISRNRVHCKDAGKDFSCVIDARGHGECVCVCVCAAKPQGEHELNNLGWFYLARRRDAPSLRSLRLWLDHPTLLTHVKSHLISRSRDTKNEAKITAAT